MEIVLFFLLQWRLQFSTHKLWTMIKYAYALPTQMPYKCWHRWHSIWRGWVYALGTSLQRLLNTLCGPENSVRRKPLIACEQIKMYRATLLLTPLKTEQENVLPLKIANDAHFNVHSTVYTSVSLSIHFHCSGSSLPASCRIEFNLIALNFLCWRC